MNVTGISLLLRDGVTIYSEPLIVGMKDKDGNLVDCITLDGRTIYMTPEAFRRLEKEARPRSNGE